MRKLLLQASLLLLTMYKVHSQDLTISTFTLTSTNISTGNYIYPTVYESNIGNASSGSNYIGYYLSTDSILTIGDLYLTSSNIYSMSGGGSSYAYPSIYISSTTTSGQYYLFAYADYTGLVSEVNENNNSKYIRVTVTAPTIDLTITSPTISLSNASTGDQIYATCYITNTGNTSASYSDVGFYLSTDAVYDVNDTYLTYSYGSSLLAGSSSTRSAYLTIPAITSAGNYYILFRADYSGYVTESNETNNVIALPITLTKPNYTTVPTSGNQRITTCSTTIYDNGGPLNNYANYNNGSLTIYPATTGNYISLNFSSISLESCCDYVSIYDGASTSATLIGTYYTTPNSTIYATNNSGALTVLFSSDGSSTYSGFAATVGCVTSVPRPDLVVSSITATSTIVNPGYSVSPTVYVQNKGTAIANSSYVGYYLSTDSVYSVGDSFLTSSYFSSISSGSSSYVYPLITIPTGTVAGQYYIVAVADYYATISESNENNNSKALKISVVPPNIDLRISSISSSSTTTLPGTYLYPTVYEYNAGTTISGSNYIGFYLSTDTVYNIGDTFLTSSYISSLSGGTSTYSYPSIFIPSTTIPGQYYVIAIADYSNSVNETNENNNSRALKITVNQPNIDLRVSSFTSTSTSVSTGYYFSPTVNVYNGGTNSASSSYVGFYLSTDTTYNLGDTFLSSTSTGSISGGSITTLYPSIYISSTVAYGQYYVIAVADYSGAVSETNENNNTKAIKITVSAPVVDLKVSSFTSTISAVLPGSYLYPTITESNTGNVTSNSNYVGYYLSTDSVYSIGDTYLTSSYASAVYSGTNTFLYPSIYIPTNTVYGQYYIIAIADYSNYVTETNESNNTRAFRITVTQPNVDLRISAITATSTQLTSASYFYPTVREINSGLTSSSSNSIYFYLSTDSTYSIGDTYLTYTTVSSLSGGSSTSLSPSIYIPSGIVSGDYYVIAIADYGNNVSETNELNNTRALKITISSPFIDLKIASFSPTVTNVTSGSSLTFNVSESNNGNSSSGYHYVGYYLSSDSTYSIGDTYLTSTYISSFAAGTNYTYSASVSIPTGTSTGQYYIIAIADYSSYVAESNENNNTRAAKINVVAPNIDLVISSFGMSGIPSVAPGNSLYPTVVEYNKGLTTAGGNYIYYYLSTDSVYSIGDTYLNYSYVSSISGASSTTVLPSLYIPTSTAYGQYYVVAIADFNGSISETNEANNTKALKITVAAPIVDLTISSSLTYATSIYPGNSFNMQGYAYNAGTTSISTSTYIGFYLSNDSVFSTTDSYLGEISLSSVNPGSTSGSFTWLTIPTGTTSGQYYVIAYADYTKVLTETNENNNTKAFKINVVNQTFVDMIIASITSTNKSVLAGEYFRPTVIESNVGSGSSSGSDYIGYYLSKDSIYSIEDLYLSESSISATFSSGGYRSDSPSLYIPSNTTNGVYYIIAVADYYSNVSESNENNNAKSIKIAVGPLGLEDSGSASTPTIYPNPSAGIITLSNFHAVDEVEVFDIHNLSVFKSNVAYQELDKLDISHLPQGVYILKTKKGGEYTHTQKVIITK